jgi:hypothetical protein
MSTGAWPAVAALDGGGIVTLTSAAQLTAGQHRPGNPT